MKRCAVFFLMVVLSSCAVTKGYEGAVPEGVIPSQVRGDGVRFLAVNNIPVGASYSELEVLPGRNEIRLQVNASNFNSVGPIEPTFQLPFDAKSGVDYVVTGQRGWGRVCAWEINPETGDPDFHKSAGCIIRRE